MPDWFQHLMLVTGVTTSVNMSRRHRDDSTLPVPMHWQPTDMQMTSSWERPPPTDSTDLLMQNSDK